jgi:hypothetical protein
VGSRGIVPPLDRQSNGSRPLTMTLEGLRFRKVEIAVADNGAGIEDDDVEVFFFGWHRTRLVHRQVNRGTARSGNRCIQTIGRRQRV